ncbi:MAG: ParB/RepB/Spo0J family partition protein [Rhizobiaceae bacterium]
MSEDPAKKRLGRGLAALIGEMDKPDAPAVVATDDDRVPIDMISANPANPRRRFAETELADLAQSIREHGIVQPVVVRPGAGAGAYEIIAGERRWRAAQRAGLTNIPVIIREVDDRTALELAIVENVQRADLNPVEEARGYQQLIDEHNYTQAELGNVIGKSRSHVANTLRLLNLPDVVRDMLTDGSLSAGHARALITAKDPVALARRIIADGLSVRQAEALAQNHDDGAGRTTAKPPVQKDADTRALEKMLSDATGLTIAVKQGSRGGELKIKYRTLDQLDDLCRRIRG